MKQLNIITTLLFCIAPGTAWLDAAPATAAGDSYFTEEQVYQSRPNPARDTPFGCIGATGLMARIYPGVTVKVEQTMPGSPAAGKFSKTWPLDCKKFKKIIGQAAEFYADPKKRVYQQ